MEIKNLVVLHEKVGENDHNYYVAPGASLDEVEFVVRRYLDYVIERKEMAKKQSEEKKCEPCQENKPEEPKVE